MLVRHSTQTIHAGPYRFIRIIQMIHVSHIRISKETVWQNPIRAPNERVSSCIIIYCPKHETTNITATYKSDYDL